MAPIEATDRSPPTESAEQTRAKQIRQQDLPDLYERIRLRGAAFAVVLTICVGTITGWPNGPWVPVSCALILAHALYVNRRKVTPGMMTLLIDGAAIGAATLTMGIPVVTATGLCFYAVVASVLTSGKRATVVAAYTAAWVGLSLLWAYGGFKAPYEPESKVVIELAAVVFFTAVISVVVAVVMTELRKADRHRSEATAALAASNHQLAEMIAAKDQFVASVSHELRTPLTAVIGLARELSGPTTGFSSADLQEFHRMIAAEAEEVARIVEDLLVAARADIGEVKIHPQQVGLRDMVDDVIQATTHRTQVEALGGEAWAFADPIRVRQVLRNLAVNADRYGGSRMTTTVGVRNGLAFVEFSDDGPGVPEDSVDRIFEPYQSAHQPGVEVTSIGLGLAVSRTLARLMDGDLTYDRRNGWTVFTLTLPAIAATRPSSVPVGVS